MSDMSSPLTVKRRKLNDAANTLSKPFVSPLKSSKADQSAPKPQRNAANTPYRPSTLAHTMTAASPTLLKDVNESEPGVNTAVKSTPIRKSIGGGINNRNPKDPAELAAQKAITSLELQIRTTRNEIDTLSQAQRLSASSRDAELDELATKWKAAAQSAAEEVFGTVKERVCRMGGVQAWRESEKRKFERVHGMGEFAEKQGQDEADDDEDCEYDSQGEELPEEEVEWRKSEKKRIRQEMRDAMEDESGEVDAGETGEKKELIWQEEGGEDDVSTPFYWFL